MKHIWMIDSGHGGVIEGLYQTSPYKMFQHSPEEIFYEGVFNRMIKDQLLRKCWDQGIHVIDVCPTELDLPLPVRVDMVNDIYKHYRNAVLISLHSNAGGGTGFEVWTSVGETMSDKYAEILGHEIMASFDMPFRKDTVTGKIDKEAHFYILKETNCPAVLPECLFFDNYNDYRKLIRKDFQLRYVNTLVDFMIKSELAL